MADLYEKLKRFKQNTTSASSSANSPKVEAPSNTSQFNNSLPDSLQSIPGVMRARDLAGAIEKRDALKHDVIESLGFREETNSAGTYAVRECKYDASILQCSPADLQGKELVQFTNDDRFHALSGGDILYIDTETTGLAGGTGTLPFLIGAGWFEPNGFCVRQYFMRDYSEEPAVLLALEDEFNRFAAVSTYNGKGFDMPLIQTRYLLNRKRINLLDHPHFDLLYPARRFWRDGLPNCRLVTIEHEILGRERDEDVPSEMIPYIYFDYLRGVRMERMSPVLAHNAEDIVSLAILSAKVCRIAAAPQDECVRGVEFLGLGRYYAALEDWEQSTAYMQKSLECGDMAEEVQLRVQWQIALLFKRLKQFERAVPYWERLANHYAIPDACVELAKLFEHHHKDFHHALAWTNQALEFSQNTTKQSSQSVEEALLHRRNRLERKQAKSKLK
jgi:hypothetical protein